MEFNGTQLRRMDDLDVDSLNKFCAQVGYDDALQQLDMEMDLETAFPLFTEVDSLPELFDDAFFNYCGEVRDLVNEKIQEVKDLESPEETPDGELPENGIGIGFQQELDVEDEEEDKVEEDEEEQVTPPVTPAVEEIWVDELCAVCGDKSCGQHFGAPSCEGCKAFFRRIVISMQSEPIRSGCKGNGRCFVDKNTRGECRYCRYQKCFDVGMQRGLVHGAIMSGGTKGRANIHAQLRPRTCLAKENNIDVPETPKTSKRKHSDVSNTSSVEMSKFPYGKYFERLVAVDPNGMPDRVYVESSAWIVPRSFHVSNILDSMVDHNSENRIPHLRGQDVLNFQEKMQFYNILDMYASMPIVHSLKLPIRLKRLRSVWEYLFVLMSVERNQRPKILGLSSLQRRNEQEVVHQLSLGDKKLEKLTEILNIVFDTLESMKLCKLEILMLKLVVIFGDSSVHKQAPEILTLELNQIKEFLLKILVHIMPPSTMEKCLDTIDLMKEAEPRHLSQLLFPGIWQDTDWLMDWFFYNLQYPVSR